MAVWSWASEPMALPSRIPLYLYMSVTQEFVTGRIWCSWGNFFAEQPASWTAFLDVPSERTVAEEPMPFDPEDVRKVAVALALGGVAGGRRIKRLLRLQRQPVPPA